MSEMYPLTGERQGLHTYPSCRDENIETFVGAIRRHRSRGGEYVWRLGSIYPIHRTPKGKGFIRLGEGSKGGKT